MAVRIRARAIKRCGELLRALERPEHRGRPRKKMGAGGDTISVRKAASGAGLPKRN